MLHLRSAITITPVSTAFALTRPPSFEDAAAALRALGARHSDIERLEIFGSVARGEAKEGSDLDVLLAFKEGRRPHGWDCFGRLDDLAEEIRAALGVEVDLHERVSAELCLNAQRRASVLSGARLVYGT